MEALFSFLLRPTTTTTPPSATHQKRKREVRERKEGRGLCVGSDAHTPPLTQQPRPPMPRTQLSSFR